MLLDLMAADAGVRLRYVRADGGTVHNRFLMQFVADIAWIEVRASSLPELSALGVVLMGTLGLGAQGAELVSLEHGYDAHEPKMAQSTSDEYYQGWQSAVPPCSSRGASSKLERSREPRTR